jgi:cobyrinic acid a,c-diamide synthase
LTGAGLVIAAPRSGAGKTTLTLGLMRALARKGLAVGAAKCGPDYIDPAFHAVASGRESLNLDSWAMPEPLLRALAARTARDADIVVCEGLMGLFDGVPGEQGRTGSTADIAALGGWPVLLVLDVSGQSTTAAAIVKGLASYDPRIRLGGVVLNRVGSERHHRLVSLAIEAIGVPVLGSLPRSDTLKLPERHLGLVQAAETSGLDALIERMADFVEAHVDVERVLRMAGAGATWLARLRPSRDAPPVIPGRATDEVGSEGKGIQAHGPERMDLLPSPPWATGLGCSPHLAQWRLAGDDTNSAEVAAGEGVRSIVAIPPPGQRIALARDEAFSFIYPHLLQGWRESGAELVMFSPLANEPPPADCDVCWLPGGYPELHAGRIAAASLFLEGLRRFAASKPVHGECGGYMVLGRALTDAAGESHAMAGLLSVVTSFAKRKLQLGYRDARILADGPLGRAGGRLKGHEFHYSTILDPGEDEAFAEVGDAYGGALQPSGGRRGLVSGSFFHAIARAQ